MQNNLFSNAGQKLGFAEINFTPAETARKVAKATGCTFAVAASAVDARGGDFKRACQVVRELRAERGR